MARLLSAILAFAFALTLSSGMASAKTCRDAKGKFVKCPVATAAPAMKAKPKSCKDPKTGKFVKCPK